MAPRIEVGTRVQYSAKFLRSVGMYTGPTAFATGTVYALVPVPGSPTVHARIQWAPPADPRLPDRVNVANLWPCDVPEPD